MLLRNWFRTSAQRPSAFVRSVRPWLEKLEDRLAPAAGGIPGPPPGHGPGGPPGPPPGPPGPPAHINAHDSFNTTITDSFNTSINNVTVNQYTTVAAAPAQAQQALSSGVGLAAQMSPQALFGLITDEVHLAVDTYLSLAVYKTNNPDLTQDMHNLQLSIQSNPLETTAIGEAVGFLTFDVVLDAVVTANNGGNGGF